jgi:outer membrane protein assembly factor BamB
MRMSKKYHPIIVLVSICLFFSGCVQSQTPDPVIEPTSIQAAKLVSTAIPQSTPIVTAPPTVEPTALPLPVNAAMMDEAVVLTAGNIAFVERVADLWPDHTFVSNMALYPGKEWIVLGRGNSHFSSPFSFLGLSGKTRIVLWDPRTNEAQEAFETGGSDEDTFNSVAVSPDGRNIAFIGNNRLVLGSSNNEATERELAFTTQEISLAEISYPQPDLGAVFSPDSRLLAVANAVGDIFIWDVQANQKVAVFKMGTQLVQGYETPLCAINARSLAFTHNGDALLSSCNGEILSWDPSTLQHSSIKNIIGNTVVFALSPGDDTLVTGTFEGDIKIWNFPSGDLEKELSGHSMQVSSLAFSADGNLFASSWQDDIIEIWDARSWTRLATLKSPADFLAFSADGKFLVSGTHDEGGTLWGVRSAASMAQRSGVEVVLSEGGPALDSWQAVVPAEWLSQEGTFPRYEIRIVSEWLSVEDCHYDISGTQRMVFRRKSVVSVQIVDMKTGIKIGETSFEGSQPAECPETRMFSQNSFTDYIEGDDPDIEPFLPWLTEVMRPLGY